MNGILPITGCDNAERKADIIFVHGLGGNALSTWHHQNDPSKNKSDSWPYWLGKDFPEVGVWTISYSSSPSVWVGVLRKLGLASQNSGYTMPLVDRATQILDSMANKKLGERPLMFICHSLGGLVVKQVLRLSNEAVSDRLKKQVIENTRVVMFLATPHNGVRLNFFLSFLLKLPGSTITIKEICLDRENITSLYRWYCEYAREFNIQTVSYRETRPFHDIFIIVDESSSYPGIGPLTPLDENHVSIAKPKKSSNQVCEKASALVREHLIQTSSREEKLALLKSKSFLLKNIQKRDFVLVNPTKHNDSQRPEEMSIVQLSVVFSFENAPRKRNLLEEKKIADQINKKNSLNVCIQLKEAFSSEHQTLTNRGVTNIRPG